MSRYRTTFATDTPITDAFDYLSRFSSAAEWDPSVVGARDLTPGPVRPGSAYEVVSSVAGRHIPLRYEVIQLERPARVVLHAETSAVTSRDEITFIEAPDGTTTITYQAELRPRGITRVLAPLLALIFRRLGDRAAEGLRATLDGRPVRPHDRP